MKHLFVPYELVKLAEEKGYVSDMYAGWYAGDGSGEVHYEWRLKLSEWMIGAPLYQQLVDWFFDKHNILIEPLFDANGMWCVWITDDITKTHRGSGNFLCFDNKHCLTNEFHGWKDKYEALTKALEEAFKLIP